jgi:hypothetical protein
MPFLVIIALIAHHGNNHRPATNLRPSAPNHQPAECAGWQNKQRTIADSQRRQGLLFSSNPMLHVDF